jgi:hypothetical protein
LLRSRWIVGERRPDERVDPGFGPTALLQEIRRASRCTQAELDLFDLDGATPDAAGLARAWHVELLRRDEPLL